MKLWHDDVRPAPEGWVWARTNDEAIKALETGAVTHISMDHDLGNHDLEPGTCDMGPGSGSGMPQKGLETGADLARWMADQGIIPDWIRVHSWNYSGSATMIRTLEDAGGKPFRQVFQQEEVLHV